MAILFSPVSKSPFMSSGVRSSSATRLADNASLISIPDAVEIRFGKAVGGSAFRAYQAEAEAFIDTQCQRIQQRYIDRMRADSRYYKLLTPEADLQSRQMIREDCALYREPDTYERLCDLVSNNNFAKLSPVARRTLEVLKEDIDKAQPPVSMQHGEVREQYYRLVDDIDEDTNNLDMFLETVDYGDPEWKNQVLEGYDKSYIEVARNLVKKRNQLAHMHGFRNYFEMLLAQEGLSKTFLDETLQAIDSKISDPKTGQIREELHQRELYIRLQLIAEDYGFEELKGKPGTEAWKYYSQLMINQRDQERPDWKAAIAKYRRNKLRFDRRTKRVLREEDLSEAQKCFRKGDGTSFLSLLNIMRDKMGWPSQSTSRIRFNMEEDHPGTSSFNLMINPPYETELFVGAASRRNPLTTRFHEAGHAFGAVLKDPNLPFPLRLIPSHISEEGMGRLFELVPDDPSWAVDDMSELSPAELRKFKQLSRYNDLFLVLEHFSTKDIQAERAMYEILTITGWFRRSLLQSPALPYITSSIRYGRRT